MSAHAAWRLTIYGSVGGSAVQLSELYFLDAAQADLSVGGTPGASSGNGALAFDRNTATSWQSSGLPASIWYSMPNPCDVRYVRLRLGGVTAYIPRDPLDLRLSHSDDGGASWSPETAYILPLVSGTFTTSGDILISVYDRAAVSVGSLPLPGRLYQDMRHARVTSGVIADRVMFRSSASSPEAPFESGRVWLLRAADGFKAWEGWSDAQGYYRAEGLELGVAYIAVGIDPWGNHKTAAAGPVVATLTGVPPDTQ